MKTYNWNSDESYSEWIDDVMNLLSIPSEYRFAFCGEHGETLDLNWDERVTPDVAAFLIKHEHGEPFYLIEGKEMEAYLALREVLRGKFLG